MPDENVDPPIEEVPTEPVPEVPVVPDAPSYPIGYEPEVPQEDTTDPTYEEQFPEEEIPFEPPVVDDGKMDAEGSIWRLYYLPGRTPTEYQMRNLTGSVKATIITEPGETLSRITPQ